MFASAETLVAEYFRTGTLSGLPMDHFIDGAFVPSSDGAELEILDPGRGEAFARVADASTADVDRAVESACQGLKAWRRAKPAERGRVLMRTAAALRDQAERLAVIEALHSGKTLPEARGDVGSAARLFEYYGGAADKIQGDSIPLGQDYFGFTLMEPVGVTAHIIPWNYPISTFVRSVAPALAAGCSVVAKPAETTPLTALLLARILAEAGLPAGVCNVVAGTGRGAGAALAAHPGIDHVSFTGSPATGTSVMQAAARHFASVTLELGGKSPVIALADCDLQAAANGVMGAIFENAGQICSAGSRLVVERPIHDALVGRIVEKASLLRVGHGLKGHDVGAINSQRQLDKVMGFLDEAARRGRRIATGGRRAIDPNHPKGWYVQPTVIDDLPIDDPCVQEEIFGPVLAVQIVDSPAAALTAANATRYGLMAGIYTRNLEAALALCRDLRSGQVTVNDYWGGGVEMPFGGTGHSGFGREKGLEALRTYSRVKSMVHRLPPTD
jgi:acyl-CoA reductase-like NAD-dependent aldehyde dehydrogenase